MIVARLSPQYKKIQLMLLMLWPMVVLVQAAVVVGSAAQEPRILQQEEGACQWTQVGQDIDAEREGDRFGWSIALTGDGSRVAVGASDHDGPFLHQSGQARVWDFNATSNAWEQLGSSIYGVNVEDHAGRLALSSDGNVLAVGARWHDANGADDSGHVRVFVLNGTEWEQQGQEIKGDSAGDNVGNWVALNADGSILAISASGADGPAGRSTGLVRIFEFDGEEWLQLGEDIFGDSADAYLASSIRFSADGRIVAMGSARHDSSVIGDDSGLAKVYRYVENEWILMGQMIEGEATQDESGFSVAISADGSVLAVTAIKNDGINGADSGHVRVYKYNEISNEWEQVGPDIDGESANDNFGWSVSLSSDGSVLAVGAFSNDGETGRNSGHTRIYQFQLGIGWVQLGNDIDGEAAEDRAGSGVYLSEDGTIVAIKADFNTADLGPNSGHARVFQLPSSCISSDMPVPFELPVPPEDQENDDNSLPTAAIAGLVVASVLVIAFIVGGISIWNKKKQRKALQLSAAAGSDEESGMGSLDGAQVEPFARDTNRLPTFKDQAHGSEAVARLEPQTAKATQEDPYLPSYKDQVRSNSALQPRGPSTVVAHPEHAGQGNLANNFGPRPVTAHVLAAENFQRVGFKDQARSVDPNRQGGQGDAIPVALAIFIDENQNDHHNDNNLSYGNRNNENVNDTDSTGTADIEQDKHIQKFKTNNDTDSTGTSDTEEHENKENNEGINESEVTGTSEDEDNHRNVKAKDETRATETSDSDEVENKDDHDAEDSDSMEHK